MPSGPGPQEPRVTPFRLWAQERFYASPLLQRAFRARQTGRARRAAARGRLLEAAACLLRGWKHAGGERLPPAAEALWQRLLGAARDAQGRLRPARENPFLAAWAASPEAQAERRRRAEHPLEDRVRLRTPRADAPPTRPGDLLLLKEPGPVDAAGRAAERGVLLVTYHAGIGLLPMVFDLAALAPRFTLVLEPSTWGYMDARFLPYLGADVEALVEAQCPPDHAWIEGLGSNLAATTLGAGDWADPDLFRPSPGPARRHDVCMVAAWDALKRHALLFDALAALKRRGRRLTASLVGYRLDWGPEQVERLARRAGVRDQVTLLDKVPQAEVARQLADARVSVLLSRREGANRALYESWFCDTPTVVHRHHRGVNLAHAGRPEVGLLADDHELPEALLAAVDHPERFAPRAWALAHTGCHVATRRLEQHLALLAERAGRPFTRGLALRAAGGLVRAADHERLAAPARDLARLLRPL